LHSTDEVFEDLIACLDQRAFSQATGLDDFIISFVDEGTQNRLPALTRH